MRYSLSLITLIFIFSANQAVAETVVLETGESYNIDDVNVVCVESKRSSFVPVPITDCQHWDDFNQVCLHEKTILTTGKLECVEDCQHWDDFNKKCLYQTSCIYDRNNDIFIKTTCQYFDRFAKACVRLEQKKIDS